MAFWVLGGGNPLHHRDADERAAASCFDGGKRRGGGYHAHGGDEDRYELHKRARIAPWGGVGCDGDGDDFMHGRPYGGYEHEHQHQHQHQHQHHHRGADDHGPPLRDSVPVRNLAFLVIREGGYPPSPLPSPSPSPEPTLAFLALGAGHYPGGHHPVLGPGSGPGPGPGPGLPPCAAAAAMDMERTESGLSISSSASAHDALSSLGDGADASPDALAGGGSGSHPVVSDLSAAALVRAHLASHRRRLPDSQPERILRALIAPRTRAAAFALDDAALRSIFSAANELFFGGRLARRVAWDWSHPSRQAQWHASHIVGTTALRRCALLGGWETLIVLSSPILRDTRYNRRLLIATFLHEMIHSFMFVVCGPGAARTCGGHTQGFREIAGLIDEWAGREYLRMSDMEADLERFRGDVDDEVFPPPVDDMAGNLVEPEWRHGHDAGGGHVAELQPPRQRPRHDDGFAHGEWQWYEREDFGARGPHASGCSPYVY